MQEAHRVRESLLQYQRAPGQYNVSQRQPAVLFESLREVLNVAIARDAAARTDVQAAARFFIRAALLHASADHYTLLGLTPNATPEAIKERYRLMMRLLHPDFERGDGSHWPADTAARVNLAYEVLSNPAKRQSYDAARATPASAAFRARPPAMPPVSTRGQGPRPQLRSWRHTSRTGLKALAIGLAVLGGGLALLALVTAVQQPQYLVQRQGAGVGHPSGSAVSTAAAPLALVIPAETSAADRVAATPGAPVRAAAAGGPLAAAGLASTAPLTFPRPPTPPVSAMRVGTMVSAAGRADALAAPAAPASLGSGVTAPLTTAQADSRALAVPAAEPSVVQTPQPAVTAPAAVAAPVIGGSPSLADVQPLLALVLHSVQSARGDALLNLIDRDGRRNVATQRLARQVDAIGGGARITSAQLKPEASDQALLVSGELRVETESVPVPRKLLVRMTFTSRDGAVVLSDVNGQWMP